MGETNVNHRTALPKWVTVVALVISILGLTALATLEIGDFQFPTWFVKLIPAVILVGFYLAVLLIK